LNTLHFPDSTVRERRDRVRVIRNSDIAIPVAPITVSLAPTCGS
jgi:predicted ATPase with chaperone activity